MRSLMHTLKERSSVTGFTLIELLVVMIIIGILAAVAAPMISSGIQKAIKTEAIVALGTIRNAMRAYYAEYGRYYPYGTGVGVGDAPIFGAWPPGYGYILGFNNQNFDGTYFSNNCYTVTLSLTPSSTDLIKCWPDRTDSSAPKYRDVNSWTGDIIMYVQNGEIVDTAR